MLTIFYFFITYICTVICNNHNHLHTFPSAVSPWRPWAAGCWMASVRMMWRSNTRVVGINGLYHMGKGPSTLKRAQMPWLSVRRSIWVTDPTNLITWANGRHQTGNTLTCEHVNSNLLCNCRGHLNRSHINVPINQLWMQPFDGVMDSNEKINKNTQTSWEVAQTEKSGQMKGSTYI